MGSCTQRHFLLTICILQLVTIVECQIFDFLGYMYGPILANFIHIILVIIGFFGAYQYRSNYILSYGIWNILWLTWSIFVVCFYLDVGSLHKDSDILNLGTGSRSWWEINGYGCVPDFTTNGTSIEADPDPSRPLKPTKVTGCFLQYYIIEALQASIQCLLSIFAIIVSFLTTKMLLMDEDDSCENKSSQDRPTLYTLEPGYHTNRQHIADYQHQLNNGYVAPQLSPRPMTPRKVKRRSVMARDTMNRASLTHRRQGSSRSRSSQRRHRVQNPVTRLIEQQNRFLDSSTTSNDSARLPLEPSTSRYRYRSAGHTNPVFEQTSSTSLHQSGTEDNYRPTSARSSYSNYHGSRPISYISGNNEYFSNQAVAQVPINTSRRKTNNENKAPAPSNLNSTNLKSFSHKNFNFLGKNNNNEIITKFTDVGESSTSFFNKGPPAYSAGNRDSETVI